MTEITVNHNQLNSPYQRLGGGAVYGDSGKSATYKINRNIANGDTRVEFAILENRKDMEAKRLERTSISLTKLMETEGSYKPLFKFVQKLNSHFSPETVQEFVANLSKTVSKIKI